MRAERILPGQTIFPFAQLPKHCMNRPIENQQLANRQNASKLGLAARLERESMDFLTDEELLDDSGISLSEREGK
jgi:hypothetical protein